MDSIEARLALDAKRSAERSLATVAPCPPWRHAVFGLMLGGTIATPAIPLPYRFVALALIFVALPLIVRSDRRRTGVFINGYRRGRTRLVTAALLAGFLLLYSASAYAALGRGDIRTPLLLAIVGGIGATLGSIQWQRVFVREMGA